MKKILLLLIALSISYLCRSQVDVSTGGSPTTYTTLKDAFDAINAGTHTGTITIAITANTTETAPCVLNSSGAGSASYASVYIYPSSDGLTITGPGTSTNGRGVIELNGADNVTIDGDNPNTSGINRNLTIINNSTAASANYTMVIRLAAYTSVITSADNNTIKNCILTGSAAAQNVSTVTSTSGPANTTYGIYAGAWGSSAPASNTTVPAAITSVSTLLASGGTITNLNIDNNEINACARAIMVQGSAATVATGLQITNNLIGASATGSSTNVYSYGIGVQGSSNGLIKGNKIQNVESYISTSLRGISVGDISSVSGDLITVENNIVSFVISRTTSGYAAYGISIAGGTGNIIKNNMIFGLNAVQNNNAYGTTYGVRGIRISASTNHKVYHNTVYLSDAMLGTATDVSACLTITSASLTGIDVRNNIFSNVMTGTSTSTITDVQLISSATSSMNLTLNNNAYYTGSAINNYLLSTTTGSAVTTNYTAANFNPAATTPSTNARAFTSTLSAAGTNDNASFASTAAAPFTSSTNLHIPAGTTSQLESGGATVGVGLDIDGDVRPGPSGSIYGGAIAPDLGADEFDGVPLDIAPPVIIYTALANTSSTAQRTLNVTITDALSGIPVGANQPVLYWQINSLGYTGPVAPSGIAGSVYTFQFGAGVVAGDVVSYFVVAQDNASNVTSFPGGATVTANPPLASAGPPAPSTYLILGTICGPKTVGTGGDFATLTAAFAALNANELCGPVTLSLLDASYSSAETFPLVLNANPAASATNTVTIKPASGVSPSISGALTSTLVKILNPYTIIDGSNSVGGTSRDLTITNTSATTPQVLVIGSVGTTPIVGVTLKNTILINGVNTSSALIVSDGTTAGNAGYFNNITIENNSIRKAYAGLYVNAAVATGNGSVLITKNDLNSTGADAIRYIGIYVQGADGAVVSKNNIGNFDGTTGEDDNGIWFASGTKNSTIEKNQIFNLNYLGTSGYGGRGIAVSTAVTGSNIMISNNMIYNISGDGYTATTDYIAGINVYGTQTGVKIYHNSINLYGNTLNYTSATAHGLFLGTGSTADIKDNIIVNNLGLLGTTGIGSVGIYLQTSAAQLEACNYNDIWVNPTGSGVKYIGQIGSTGYTSLATWQTASSQDANSVSVDPKFQSNSDLHIITSYPNVNNIGQYLASVPTDIDGDTRNDPPDLGADEYIYVVPTVDPPVSFSAAATGSTQIDLTFTTNSGNTPVVIVWNLTGTFTDPTGTPTLNGSLAGGTVLSIGTASPVSHQNLTVSTHYYYKAFSWDGSNYSSGLTTDATTLTPVLTVAPTNLAFGYVAYPGTSAEQTYTLSGTNLAGAGNITITAPAAFEVSLTTGTGFGSSVLVPFTGPTLAATTIYVRFVPAAAGTAYSGNITNDGGSAAVKNVAVTGSSDPYGAYCASYATSTADEDIFNVTVGTLNNSSDCSMTGGTGSMINQFSNYTYLTPPDLQQGASVAFSLTSGTCGGNYGNCFKIFIDYNQDGDFADIGEEVYVSSASATGPHTETGSFIVPVSATLGNTYMRVINRETSTPSSITACGTYSWGETEDYKVNITVATAPSLAAVPNTLNFGYTPVGGTSAPQSYTLTGLALSPPSGNIVVTAPSMFQVSLTSGSGYASSINVPYTGGAVNTTVYAVFAPTVAGTYSDNITNNGGGASAPVAVSGTTNIVYCSAGSTYCDEYISRVQLNTIDNSSSCSSGGYADYSALSTQLTKGSIYTATITNGLPYTGDQCGVWIDWNNNGSFYDAGEAMTVTGGTTVYTATIAPPAGALETSVRMRIRICYTSGLDPCGTATYGEVEDYTITVMPALAHDVGVVSIDNMTSLVTAGTVVTPKATVANFGTNTETFTVTMTSNPGTYTSTQTVTALAPGATVQLTFANWTAEAGSYVFEATAELESDLNNDNNKKSFALDVFEAGNGTWGSGSSIITGAYMGSAVGWVDNAVTPPVGYLFTIGGNTTTNTDVQKYNEATDTWTTLASLPAGKTVLGTALVGNYIYAIAGSSGGVVSSTVYKYDIIGNSWTAVSDIPTAMRWNKAVAYGNYIYVAGGLDASDNVLSSVYIYNTLTDSWSTATPMPGGRFGGAFSITGNTLVYAGGADIDYLYSSLYVGTINLSDPTIVTWAAKSSYPGTQAQTPVEGNDVAAEIATPGTGGTPKAYYPGGPMYRFDAAPWGTDGVIITTGSPTANWTPANPNPCFVYKPATDSWIVQPNLPIPVLGSYFGSVDKNNSGAHTWKLIVASGYTGSGVSTATQILTEIFAPPTKTLNLKLYLEGFVKTRGGIAPAPGFMYKAQVSPDGSITSDAFAGTVVDTLTVALANSAAPYSIAYYKHSAQLNTDGTMSLSIPATYSGNYYIAIRHRQSIETWSAAPVSFSGSTINYDFSTAASQAYGSNQASLGASWGYGLYAGDIVKDGYIDLSEVNATYSSARLAQYSYLLYDFTGNGFVELDDVNLIYANYRTSKSFLWPGATK